MFNNFDYIVGRTWTHTYNENKHILGNCLIDKNWADVISEFGKTEHYPKDVYIMSGIAIDPLLKLLKILKLNDKENLLSIISNASLGVNWLYNSKYNSEMGHPLEQGHQWWADYIYEFLKTKNNKKI